MSVQTEWVARVRRARLGTTTKAVALVLAAHSDADGTNARPGHARLVVECELSHKTVKDAVKKLVTDGFIEVVKKGNRPGVATTYRLVLDVAEVPSVREHDAEIERVALSLRQPPGNHHKPRARGTTVPCKDVHGELHPPCSTGNHGAVHLDEEPQVTDVHGEPATPLPTNVRETPTLFFATGREADGPPGGETACDPAGDVVEGELLDLTDEDDEPELTDEEIRLLSREVLPSIRKTGSWVPSKPAAEYPDAVRRYITPQETRLEVFQRLLAEELARSNQALADH